jgi:hypothetical protein
MISFRQFIIEVAAKGGYDYEDSVNDNLKKQGLQKKDRKSAGASKDAPDGTIRSKDGKHHNLEIKQNKNAMMGQIGMHHDGKSWQVKPDSKKKYPETAKHIEKHVVPHMNKHMGKPSGDYEKDKKEHGNHYIPHNGTEPIRDHYAKDRKTSYIQIGKSGLHHTDHDHGGFGTKPLNGNTRFRVRVKYHGTNKKTGNVHYSHTVTMELKDHEKSHLDLDHHAEQLGRIHGEKK